MITKSPFELHRKVWAELRGRRIGRIVTVKSNVSILIAKPDFLGPARKVELHLAPHVDHAVGQRTNLHTNLRSNRHRGRTTMRKKTFIRNPCHIGHLHPIRSFHRTFGNDTSTLKFLPKNRSNLRLKTSVPVRCRTHYDLVKTIRFDLVGQILQDRIFANFFPSSHVWKLPPGSLPRNPQFGLS